MESKPQPPNDEIDLRQVFSAIGSFFAGIGQSIVLGIMQVRRSTRKNRVLLLALAVLGLGGGYTYAKFIRKRFYNATMILSSDYLNRRIVDNSMEKLNRLCLEKEREGLASILSLTPELAKMVRRFEASPFVAEKDIVEIEVLKEQLANADIEKAVVQKVISNLEIENKNAFQITVYVYDPKVVSEIGNGLVGYFRNNDFIKKRIEINRQNLMARKAKLERESRKLDSLKSVIYNNLENLSKQSREPSSNLMMSEKFIANPMDVYKEDYDFYNQLQSAEKDLYLQPDFEVVDGFTSIQEPASAGTAEVMAWGLFVGLGLGYLVILLRNWDKALSRLERARFQEAA
jgi:hypothetical protein